MISFSMLNNLNSHADLMNTADIDPVIPGLMNDVSVFYFIRDGSKDILSPLFAGSGLTNGTNYVIINHGEGVNEASYMFVQPEDYDAVNSIVTSAGYSMESSTGGFDL